MIERHHLAILREVDRRGSLTSAAESLNLTQSALSHAVRKLEGQIGTALWQKDGRGLRLTEAGSFLLGVAQRLLPQLEHAETVLQQMAQGQRGTLRIGIECHPCQRWLLRIVEPYLKAFTDVDVDIKQKFQFGGIGALYGHEIDILITPDPLRRDGLSFKPILAYEQVLVVSRDHALASKPHIDADDLSEHTLISYPVDISRLDIFTDFLLPASCRPKRHKTIEHTEVMLQMVAAGRGVAALPRWLVEEYSARFQLSAVRLGARGIHKHLFVGVRRSSLRVDYVKGFVELALTTEGQNASAPRARKRAQRSSTGENQ